MISRYRSLLLTLPCLTFFGCGQEGTSAHGVKAVGLRTERMNYYASAQQASNWCWAACIQMILSAHDVPVSQQEIVATAFGDVVNRPGQLENIQAVLNATWVDRRGAAKRVIATPRPGPPQVGELTELLRSETPVIVCYQPDDATVGHAVIVTAVITEATARGEHLVRLVVRDPWPDFRASMGKRTMIPSEYQTIWAYYVVTVEEP